MTWLLTIPAIIYFTFSDLIGSGFPNLHANDARGFLGWCFLIVVGCFFSFVISLVPFGIAAFIGSLPERRGVKDKEYELIALRQQDGVSGQFYFLGAGVISDQQYYFWYRKQDDGSVRGGKTERSSGVRIYESERPHMTTFKDEYKRASLNDWFWLIGLDMREDDDYYPDFYIPKGSIKEGFSL